MCCEAAVLARAARHQVLHTWVRQECAAGAAGAKTQAPAQARRAWGRVPAGGIDYGRLRVRKLQGCLCAALQAKQAVLVRTGRLHAEGRLLNGAALRRW